MKIFCDPEQPFIDLNDPDPIEVTISRAQGKIWVNVGGVCMFRAQNVESLDVKEIARRREYEGRDETTRASSQSKQTPQ
jgi:hypothetical protein